MRADKLEQLFGILLVALHSKVQSFETTENEEGVKRTGNSAKSVLHKLHASSKIFVVTADHSHNNVTVPVDILGNRMVGQVCTMIQWVLEERSGESVVHNDNSILIDLMSNVYTITAEYLDEAERYQKALGCPQFSSSGW